jgi:hypothetical protein
MKLAVVGGVAAAVLACATSAGATNLIVNGDFETGDLSGWTVVDQAGGSGSWYIAGNGAGSPLNGFATQTLAGGGNYNAQTDQGGPGSHQLEQSFVGVAGHSYVLSFDVFANDLSGASPVGSGLDYTVVPNQHVELNLYGPTANVNVYSGDVDPADWHLASFDLSPYITGNGVYTIAFGEVDNQLYYNLGIDNVRLDTRGGVPEPATWAMMLMGAFGLGAALRARKSAARALA